MHTSLESPIGTVLIEASDDGILRTGVRHEPRSVEGGPKARAHLDRAHAALDDYFKGTRRSFEDLTLCPHGTPFQRRVWNELLKIPFGETTSYGEIAHRLGTPKASRAVGLANGSNPIGIIVPCHRVIGSNGRLTGYASGLPMKQWLLRHESQIAGGQMPFSFAL